LSTPPTKYADHIVQEHAPDFKKKISANALKEKNANAVIMD